MKGDPLPYSMPGVAEGHVIGWRVWEIASDGMLRSLVADCVWPPGEPVTSRSAGAANALEFPWAALAGDKIGVFAFKDQYDAESAAEARHLSVAGRVALWGEVAQHRRGWRAEYAYPLSFIAPSGRPLLDSPVARAAELYDCAIAESALSVEQRDVIRARCEREVTVLQGVLTLMPQMTAGQRAHLLLRLLQQQTQQQMNALAQQRLASVQPFAPGQMVQHPPQSPGGLFSWLFGGGR